MAQMYRRQMDQDEHKEAFRFNASAPEFVPTAPQISYFQPYVHYIDGSVGAWICVGAPDKEIGVSLKSKRDEVPIGSPNSQIHESKSAVLSDEIKNKIIKQAEYMFSDISMLANETLVKYVNKDPEGFVPINFVTTLKKLKTLNVNCQTVARALSFSKKLDVSSDGKKVKRKKAFTDKEKEELQMRTVIAENLPDDHSHQKIEKIFNSVGSIRSIRICQPQDPNSRSSKGDAFVSNKLHALIEYENPESAEKAAEKLNDERNWRKGMRVRVMLERSPRSILSDKSEFDYCVENEDHTLEDPFKTKEEDGNLSGMKNTRGSIRAKTKVRHQVPMIRGLPVTDGCVAQPIRRPKMPDGTRGFTMGRGKPLATHS